MEEEMAKAEITSGIIGPSKEEIESLTGKGAERGLIPWIPGKWKKAIGVVVGIGGAATTGAVIWEITHPPAITEPASAAQSPPEIVVPPKTEDFERFRVQVEAPETEIIPQPEVAISLNLNYTIRPYDTLSEIAQRFGTTQEEILALNPEIKNPSLIHPGEELVIPEVSVEKTVEFLQDLQKKVDEIYDLRRKRLGIGRPYIVQKGDTLWDIAERYKVSVDTILHLNLNITNPRLIFPGQELRMPEDVVPSQVLGEIFDRVGNDLARIQEFVEKGEENSFEARKTLQEIMEYWNTAPGEKEKIEEPEIIVNPEAENGEWIARQIKEFLRYLPNSGRVVEKIFIEPRKTWPDWIHAAGMFSFKDHGAHIWIFEYRLDYYGEREEWTRDALIGVFFHEFSHGASLYSEGYNLCFIPPTEVVGLVYQDTVLWDKEYRPSGEAKAIWGTEEEESNASIASYFLRGKESIYYQSLKPEIVQAKLEFVNYWLSKQLGENIDIIKMGEQLGFR